MAFGDPNTQQQIEPTDDVEPISDELVSNWMTLFGQGAAMLAIGLIGADSWPWPTITWAFVAIGSLIAISALPSLGSSFRVPATPNGRGLRTGGLYAVTRNPMYLGLILVATGICLDSRALAWLFFAFLVFVLLTKIASEERFLAKTYPEFSSYRTKVKKLIPFIW